MVAIYASIKEWINVPFIIRPFVKRGGDGTKQFADNSSAMCYPVGNVKLVTDTAGSEITSTTQLYVDGNVSIKVTDNVIFSGEERPVLRVASFYRDGVEDIKVVYL